RFHHLKGADPAGWHVDVPSFHAVRYAGLYPGVDVVYRGDGRGGVAYDLYLAPGADPDRVGLRFDGADTIRIDADGALVVTAAGLDLRMSPPRSHQEGDAGERVPVASRFVAAEDGTVRFALGAYDRGRALVIDPELAFSTFLGAGDGDCCYSDMAADDVALDAQGNVYVTGSVAHHEFPPITDDIRNTFCIMGLNCDLIFEKDVVVMKLDASGSNVVWATVIGGANDDDPSAIEVDASGRAVVVGETGSMPFPVKNAVRSNQANIAILDAFVLKLTADGKALHYSTHLGGDQGNDRAFDVAVDSLGGAYVVGLTNAPDFLTGPSPCGPGVCPFQDVLGGSSDGFVTHLDTDGALVYSTFLGGTGSDDANAVAVDAAGRAHVLGLTGSSGFPTKGVTSTMSGTEDLFVAKLEPNGNDLVYSRFLGGSGIDTGEGIAVDPAGGTILAGITASSDFPVKAAFDSTCGSTGTCGWDPVRKRFYSDAFVTKLTSEGAIVWSTYLGGGDGYDRAADVEVDVWGRAHVGGKVISNGFPATPGGGSPCKKSASNKGCADIACLLPHGFYARFSAAGKLRQTLQLGGMAGKDQSDRVTGVDVSAKGGVVVAGHTYSSDFPTPTGAYDDTMPTGSSGYGWGDSFATGLWPDCNENGVRDSQDIGASTSKDKNGNSIPDECDAKALKTGGSSILIVDVSGFEELVVPGPMDRPLVGVTWTGGPPSAALELRAEDDDFWLERLPIPSGAVYGLFAADVPLGPGASVVLVDDAPTGTFEVRVHATASLLADALVEPADVRLLRLDPTPDGGEYQPAGDPQGEGPSTGTVGDQGYFADAEGDFVYWAVQSATTALVPPDWQRDWPEPPDESNLADLYDDSTCPLPGDPAPLGDLADDDGEIDWLVVDENDRPLAGLFLAGLEPGGAAEGLRTDSLPPSPPGSRTASYAVFDDTGAFFSHALAVSFPDPIAGVGATLRFHVPETQLAAVGLDPEQLEVREQVWTGADWVWQPVGPGIGEGSPSGAPAEYGYLPGPDEDFVVWAVAPVEPAVDSDGDGRPDPDDLCPTVADPGQADQDADGVGDACDNCVTIANPRVGDGEPFPGAVRTGDQYDGDGDGWGNACDADFDQLDAEVTEADLDQFREALGRSRSADLCPEDDGAPGGACAEFDLDGEGVLISLPDLQRVRSLLGGPLPPRCDACPLPNLQVAEPSAPSTACGLGPGLALLLPALARLRRGRSRRVGGRAAAGTRR
ncbi:MAG: hypothetical protein HKP30_13890, partial [Myxococcales bacterium]|nr:hypothetical protein [Myxococcales bacterium]